MHGQQNVSNLMLFRAIAAACYKISKSNRNTFYVKNIEF